MSEDLCTLRRDLEELYGLEENEDLRDKKAEKEDDED